MYHSRPDIYELLDTFTLEMKEELLEYLKADIAAEKAAPKKTYLEEQWKKIERWMEYLKYEPYIDDQIQVEEIDDLCHEMINSGKLADEPWNLRREIIEQIIDGEFFDCYCVYDAMHDLYRALMLTKEEKLEIADYIFKTGSGYMMREAIKIYKEYEQFEKYYPYAELCLADKQVSRGTLAAVKTAV